MSTKAFELMCLYRTKLNTVIDLKCEEFLPVCSISGDDVALVLGSSLSSSSFSSAFVLKSSAFSDFEAEPEQFTMPLSGSSFSSPGF